MPVVILTSSDSPIDRQMTAALGVTRYIPKPSDLDRFIGIGAVLKDLLNRSQEDPG
jgi:CheY-like chemotaxis protein